jgi:hypothetical protein
MFCCIVSHRLGGIIVDDTVARRFQGGDAVIRMRVNGGNLENFDAILERGRQNRRLTDDSRVIVSSKGTISISKKRDRVARGTGRAESGV